MTVLENRYAYAHLSGAGTTTICNTRGILHSVSANTAGTSITLYDNTAGSGTVIGVIGAVTGNFVLDIGFNTALTVVVVGSADVTISYALG